MSTLPRPRRLRARLVAVIAMALPLACGPMITLEDPQGDSDGSGTTTTGPVWPTTSTSTSTSTTTTTTTSLDDTSTGPAMTTAVDFIEIPDGGPGWSCSLFLQDCPDGEKCMPWANNGGSSWNATRCSPVVDEPDGVGEPCTVEGNAVSGIDSCDYGLMCFYVDPSTLEGLCMPFCIGPEEAPSCPDASYTCPITASALPSVCRPRCHPLLDDCPPGLDCITINGGDFMCSDAGNGYGPGDACDYINDCVYGALCAGARYVPDCVGGSGCCTALCDLGDPMPPCLSGQICTPFYEAAPEGYETLGVCLLPVP